MNRCSRDAIYERATDDLPPNKMVEAIGVSWSALFRVQRLYRLYLVFTEGYLSSHAEMAIRRELCDEAIRLATILAEHPAGLTPETFALLALMHLHAARMTARQGQLRRVAPVGGAGARALGPARDSGRVGVVGQIRARRCLFPVPRGGGDRGGTLPCFLVSGDTLGQSGGVLRALGADRTLRDTQAEPCGSGSGVARTRRGTRRPRGL
jgi:hypothetical protein